MSASQERASDGVDAATAEAVLTAAFESLGISDTPDLGSQLNLPSNAPATDDELDAAAQKIVLSGILQEARRLCLGGRPMKALELTLHVVRLTRGEGAIMQVLDEARASYEAQQSVRSNQHLVIDEKGQWKAASGNRAFVGPPVSSNDAPPITPGYGPGGGTVTASGIGDYSAFCVYSSRPDAPVATPSAVAVPAASAAGLGVSAASADVDMTPASTRARDEDKHDMQQLLVSEEILTDAALDGSSIICEHCSALLKRDRLAAHQAMWCPALEGGGDSDED